MMLNLIRQANNPGITDPPEGWFTRSAHLFRKEVTVDKVQDIFNRIDEVDDCRWEAIIMPFFNGLPPTEVAVQNAQDDQPSSLESGSARGGDQPSSSLGSGDAGGEC